jgi:superfamily II DNA helicase RecQ
MEENGRFEHMWKNKDFLGRLLHFVFDEAHCIIMWYTFRENYALLGRLRLLIPDRIPIYAPTATVTPPAVRALKTSLRLCEADTVEIFRSNDRSDLHIGTRFIEHPAYSFRDLMFLVPKEGDNVEADPPCFLVFCGSQETTEEACLVLKYLAPIMKGKIAWFHSDMTPEYRAEMLDKLEKHEIWGLFCTGAFGLVCWSSQVSAQHTHSLQRA